MTETEALTLQLLRKIDEKLESLLKRLADQPMATSDLRHLPRAEFAKQIAAMTPSSVRQTDAVELLHEDRLR
jgi:hypothetical protein